EAGGPAKQARRPARLVEAHHGGRPDVAPPLDRGVDTSLAVRRQPRGAPEGGIDPARPPPGPAGPPFPPRLLRQSPRALEPLEDHRVVEAEPHDRSELGDQGLNPRCRVGQPRHRDRSRNAARHHRAAEQPMPGQALVESKQLLADPEAVRVPEGESGVVDDHADVADVVVNTLELEPDDAEPAGARRHGDAGQLLDRLAVSEDVTNARVAGDALGERGCRVEREPLEELLGALVDEAESRLEVHDRLALDAEAEVTGLDDPGVDRPHGDLEDALAFDAPERKRLARAAR